MGRPKKFDRDEILDRALPVFWRRGFSDATVQDLERATGANKSSLYSQFAGKDELFACVLRRYVARSGAIETLFSAPLGWSNIERFLRLSVSGPRPKGCPRGCFVANSVREAAILPPGAKATISTHLASLREAVTANLKAAGCREPNALADAILTFNAGLALEQNLASGGGRTEKRIDLFLRALRAL